MSSDRPPVSPKKTMNSARWNETQLVEIADPENEADCLCHGNERLCVCVCVPVLMRGKKRWASQ